MADRRDRRRIRRRFVRAGLAAALVAAGFGGWAPSGRFGSDWLLWGAPYLPLILVAVAALGLRLYPAALGLMGWVVTVAAGLVCAYAYITTDPGGWHAFFIAASVSAGILGAMGLFRPGGPGPFSRFVLTAAALAGLASLIHAPYVALRGAEIAKGAPFCLASHADGRAITRWADLRAARLYTTRTGARDTSRWYFHGLLTVDTPDGRAVWNWSPRAADFERLENPDLYIIPVDRTCAPRRDFLRTLSLG